MVTLMNNIKFLVFSLVILFACSNSFAATYTVNTSTDTVDANIGDDLCEDAVGKCSLRAAIQEANSDIEEDTIELPENTFTISIAGTGEDLSATGDFDITESLIISGASREGSKIDANSEDRIFHVAADVSFKVSNVTLKNGDATGDTGGAIYNPFSTPVYLTNVDCNNNTADTAGCVYSAGGVGVQDSIFMSNQAITSASDIYVSTANGSAIVGSEFSDSSANSFGSVYLSTGALIEIEDSTFSDIDSISSTACLFISTGGSVNISNTDFDECDSQSGAGGALYISTSESVVLDDVNAANSSSSAGGALYISSGDDLTIKNSEVTNNLASSYGGAFLSASDEAHIENCTFENNRGLSAFGGLFLSAGGMTDILDSSFTNNVGGSSGGGAYVSGGADVSITRSVFNNNEVSSGSGSGLFVSVSGMIDILKSDFSFNNLYSGAGAGLYIGSTTFTIKQSLISNNIAYFSGVAGGLYHSNSSVGTIQNTTFSANEANSGGAILSSGDVDIIDTTLNANEAYGGLGADISSSSTVQVRNSIFANSVGSSCTGGGTFTSLGYNIDQDADCISGATGDQDADPLLKDLADNGGYNKTHLLNAGSPAIDTGSIDDCPAIDQRSTVRPFDGDQDGVGVCDIGAVEFGDECPFDENKIFEGLCGCGIPDYDLDYNGVIDCIYANELDYRATKVQKRVARLKAPGTQDGSVDSRRRRRIKRAINDTLSYALSKSVAISTVNGKTAKRLTRVAKRHVDALLEASTDKFTRRKSKATRVVTRLIDQTVN